MFRNSEHQANSSKTESRISRINVTNLFCLFLGKFGFWTVRSFKGHARITAFIDHILNVLFLAAKKKMVGVYASSVIAFVKNIHTFWDRAIGHLPRESMGRGRNGFVLGVSPKVAVSTSPFYALPEPTGVGFINFAKKTFNELFVMHNTQEGIMACAEGQALIFIKGK